MNLTAEEIAVGKQNFLEAAGSTRRDFLKGTVAAGAVTGASIGAMYFGYDTKIDNPLRVGVIGTGDEGGVLIGALNPGFVEVVAIADIRPYNIHRAFHGDWSSEGTKKARPGLMDVYGWKDEKEAKKHVKVYDKKYEELLKDENVEAVIIALPLWLHRDAAIKAMRAGKPVLTEKLMGHSVHQCKEMALVAEETGLILATGHQRHYSILYDNAVDQIRSGLIGDIHHIRAQWHRSNLPGKDSWTPPLPEDITGFEDFKKRLGAAKKLGTKAANAEASAHRIFSTLRSWQDRLNKARGAEIDTWRKRVIQLKKQLEDVTIAAALEDYGYEPKQLEGVGRERTAMEELIRWRLWDRTGGGLMAELGSHQLDAASIFITAQNPSGHKVKPLSVVGVGGRSIFPADRDVDDHVYCSYEFPAAGYFKGDDTQEVDDANKKIVVTYSSINGNGFGGHGEVVLGTKGTIVLAREKEVMLYKGSSTSTKISIKKGDSGPQMDTYETGGGPAPAAVAGAAIPQEVSRGYREEIEHWAWCIKNPAPENQPKCTPEVALADAVIALTSNLALKNNERIEFKKEWFDIHSPETPEGIAPQPVNKLV